MSFMWATVLSRNYGLKVGIPAYAVAGYVGATRLQENKHHMSDIFAGATIGYIVGRTVTRQRKGGRWSKVHWMVAPARRGFVASLSFPGP
jgi:membrane-associated phospholipid phosphatase